MHDHATSTMMKHHFLSLIEGNPHSRRQRLAHVAFILVVIQLILMTRTWWIPQLASYGIFKPFLSTPRLTVPVSTPLTIQVKEILRHPKQSDYWNLKISIKNRADQSINYPSLVLTFLDEKKHIVFRNVWSPDQYMPSQSDNLLHTNEEKSLSLWLKLPEQLPAEYNLDYFYPR
jgi:hypothetical protein